MNKNDRDPKLRRSTRSRRYVSPLRQEQAELTAERVLDAVTERLRQGDRELSYAVLARQAGVSVPTVYRHFPDRQDLLEAYAARESQRRRHGSVEVDLRDLDQMLHTFFGRLDDPDDPLCANRLSVMWELSRIGTVPLRRAAFERLLDAESPGLPEPERTWLTDVAVVLVSSASAEAFRGYLQLPAGAIADRVAFAIRVLFAHAATLTHEEER